MSAAKKKPVFVAEVTTLADALSKAARVAPSKGPAFHSSAGFLLEIGHSDEQLVLKATDLEVTYRQRVNVLSVNVDEPTTWRVPVILAEIVGGMSMASGSEVSFELDDKTGRLLVKSGKKKARLPFIADTGSYPTIATFDPKKVVHVDDLAHRINQVQWCTLRNEHPPFPGINMNGKYLRATDREKAAQVPCEMDVDSPITVPLGTVATLIANLGEIRVGADQRHLLLMPDDDTQITSTIYAVDFPNIDRIQRDTHNVITKVSKTALVTAVQGLMAVVKAEKMPVLKLTFTENVIGLYMNGGTDVGELEDEVVCEYDGEPFVMHVTPRNFTASLAAAGDEMVTLACGPNPGWTFTVSDENGYRCDSMPRIVEKPGAATAEES